MNLDKILGICALQEFVLYTIVAIFSIFSKYDIVKFPFSSMYELTQCKFTLFVLFFHKPKLLNIRNNMIIFTQCQQTKIQSHVNILRTTRDVEFKVYMCTLLIKKYLKNMQKNFTCLSDYIFFNNNLIRFVNNLQCISRIITVWLKLVIHIRKRICF